MGNGYGGFGDAGTPSRKEVFLHYANGEGGRGLLIHPDTAFATMDACNGHICDCCSASPSLAGCSGIRSKDAFKADNPACAEEVRRGGRFPAHAACA